MQTFGIWRTSIDHGQKGSGDNRRKIDLQQTP
jgi:hypothetical protein